MWRRKYLLLLNINVKDEAYDEELRDYKQTITNLSQFSSNAIVFTLIHKIDKIKDSEKSAVFEVQLVLIY